MSVGSVVFGPRGDVTTDASDWRNRLQSLQVSGGGISEQTCNCVCPQRGQKKCPCALRAESAQGQSMIREGVVIDGVRYNLVRAE